MSALRFKSRGAGQHRRGRNSKHGRGCDRNHKKGAMQKLWTRPCGGELVGIEVSEVSSLTHWNYSVLHVGISVCWNRDEANYLEILVKV